MVARDLLSTCFMERLYGLMEESEVFVLLSNLFPTSRLITEIAPHALGEVQLFQFYNELVAKVRLKLPSVNWMVDKTLKHLEQGRNLTSACCLITELWLKHPQSFKRTQLHDDTPLGHHCINLMKKAGCNPANSTPETVTIFTYLFALLEHWSGPDLTKRNYFAPVMYRTLVFCFIELCYTRHSNQANVPILADHFMSNFAFIF